jgi:hypothetical protein
MEAIRVTNATLPGCVYHVARKEWRSCHPVMNATVLLEKSATAGGPVRGALTENKPASMKLKTDFCPEHIRPRTHRFH